ncbi:MAG: tetratricopeptide repeat protein [Pseudobdellovibrionaceae bacterium]
MRTKLIFLLSVGLLAGCASGNRSSNEAGTDAYENGASDSSGDSNSRSQKEAREEETPKPTQVTTRDDANVLSDAIKSGHDDSIVRAAVQILSKNPYDARALTALGYYRYKRGQYAAAQLMLGKALKANPNYSDAHTNMGLTLLALKEQREAIKSFRTAIAINNNDGNAAATLGSIYLENKDFIKALVALEIAARKNYKDPKVLNNYAVALTATGKYNDARDIYKQAMSLNSNNKDIMYNYAILLIDHLKKYDEGLDLLSKVKFLGPSTEARNKINVLENKAKAGLK